MKVICDTNIWYELYDNPSLLNQLNHIELVLTFNSLNEFRRSYNSKNPTLYQGVAKAIINFHDEYFYLNPFQYIKKLDHGNWQPKVEHGKGILDELNKLAEMPNELVVQHVQQIGEDLDTVIKESHENLEEGNSAINDLLQSIRKSISKIPKDDYRQFDMKNDLIDLISLLVKEDTGVEVSPRFDWTQLELFLAVTECYFKDLALSTNAKIKQNDWIDLFNLIYVNPGMKYWTRENKWIQIIKRVDLEPYLFEINSLSTC